MPCKHLAVGRGPGAPGVWVRLGISPTCFYPDTPFHARFCGSALPWLVETKHWCPHLSPTPPHLCFHVVISCAPQFSDRLFLRWRFLVHGPFLCALPPSVLFCLEGSMHAWALLEHSRCAALPGMQAWARAPFSPQGSQLISPVSADRKPPSIYSGPPRWELFQGLCPIHLGTDTTWLSASQWIRPLSATPPLATKPVCILLDFKIHFLHSPSSCLLLARCLP